MFELGDKVVCVKKNYPAYSWGVGVITDVQSTGDGFTIDFGNGNIGLLFSNEITKT